MVVWYGHSLLHRLSLEKFHAYRSICKTAKLSPQMIFNISNLSVSVLYVYECMSVRAWCVCVLCAHAIVWFTVSLVLILDGAAGSST